MSNQDGNKTTIAQQMPSRSDNNIKNHWNSCLKKRLERNGIDPMTHQPIITECGSSSSSTASQSSSSSSLSSARLLNKIAAGISSRQNNVDRIKNILSNPRITSTSGQEEELKEDHEKFVSSDVEEDEFLMWDEESVRSFVEEIGSMEFETTSYNGSLYNSSFQFPSPLSGSYYDHLF